MNLAVYPLCGLGSIPDRAQFREYQRTEWGPLGKSLQSHEDRETLMDQSGLRQKKTTDALMVVGLESFSPAQGLY